MESFFRGIIRFRWLVITLVLGCTGLAWVQLGKLRFESDADAMLPPSDPVISYNDLVEDRFGIRDLIIIGVLNDNPGENGVFNPRTLGIVKEFSEQIARLPGIKAVRDEDVASIATLDNITGTVDGMAVRPFMDDVPHTAEALKALQQALFHNPMYVKTNQGFCIGFAGNGYINNRFNELVVAGQVTSLVTSLGAVFLLSALMFRSWTAGLINVLPISLVMLFSFGLLGLLNIPLEVGKAFAASIVIGVGIDYTIHFLNKYRVNVRARQMDPEQITVATMTTSGKAIFFNALVVIGGFLVFLSSHFRPNFYLGAMMALNMGACLLVSMTVLPAMLNRFRPRFVFGPDGPDVRQDQVRTQQE